MKNPLTPLALGMLLVFPSTCLGQGAGSKRVLFLGNSVFCSQGGLCPSFEGFCEEAGLDYQAVSQWNTPRKTFGVEFLNYGRIPLNLPDIAADEES